MIKVNWSMSNIVLDMPLYESIIVTDNIIIMSVKIRDRVEIREMMA